MSNTGVQSRLKDIFSKMKKNNTTNPRALRELKRRTEPIAANLDQSNNTDQ